MLLYPVWASQNTHMLAVKSTLVRHVSLHTCWSLHIKRPCKIKTDIPLSGEFIRNFSVSVRALPEFRYRSF